MKRLFTTAPSAGAICAVLSATPVFAQVAGNAGDQHTQTRYVQQYKGLHGYTAKVPELANPACDVIHDFNTSASHYQYIAVCSFFH